MLLRSCQKGMNKNSMSKNQKVKLNQHGMGAIYAKNDLKIAHFCCFLDKNVPKKAISNARNFLTMQNFHFPTICFMTKKSQICWISFIQLVVMCHLYINLCIYKKNGGSCCFVLAVASASDRSSVKCSAILLKMPKSRNIKIVIRKHFSHRLKNMV